MLTIDLADEAATVAFAEDVAAVLAPGDVIGLSGGLGVGKTTFARALLRAVSDDANLEVPSPTFTLVQTYTTDRLAVAHFDLFRLADASEIEEIGLAEAIKGGAAVIEWPERGSDRLPADRLDIALEIAGNTTRRATVTAGTVWMARLERTRAVRAFLDQSGWHGARRRQLKGDASTRRYERVRANGRRAVVMDWPHAPATDDSRATYRAQDVRAFIAVDHALRAIGLSAPEIHAADERAGFLIMEDLGSEGIVPRGRPASDRYRVVVEALAAIHAEDRPSELPLPAGGVHRLPSLGAAALAAEIALFADWYPAHATGRAVDEPARTELAGILHALFARLDRAEASWVIFDVQSPNLLWLPDRKGTARIGFLDFQDMFTGPAAYDVASLCQDARVTIPVDLEDDLRGQYQDLRLSGARPFEEAAFAEAYAILATVRAFKNLGVFARQADRFGRRDYLAHVPRMREYLGRNLAHPVLSELAVWYERHLPPLS